MKKSFGSSSKALSNFAPRELLSITQAKFLCKRLFRVLLKRFLKQNCFPHRSKMGVLKSFLKSRKSL